MCVYVESLYLCKNIYQYSMKKNKYINQCHFSPVSLRFPLQSQLGN